MSAKLITLSLTAVLCLNYAIGSQIGVPVLLWQKRSTEHELKTPPLDASRSTVTQMDANVLADDYIGQSETVVAFVQKQLSLEQFTIADENRLTTVRKIFNDQSVKPTLLVDVLNPIQALTTNRFRAEQWNHVTVKNGDRVTIELPNDSLVNNNELLAKLIADIQRNVSKTALFLITGRQNEYLSVDLEAENEVSRERVRRQAVEPTEAPVPDFNGTDLDPNLVTLNVSTTEKVACLYFYASEVLVSHYNETQQSVPLAMYYGFPHNSSRDVDYGASHCWEIGSDNETKKWEVEPAFLKMTFLDSNQTELTLEMTIHTPYAENRTGFWLLNTTIATLTFHNDSVLSGKGGKYKLIHNRTTTGADIGFGYSCGQQTFVSEKRPNITEEDINNGDIAQISIRFSRLQIQPFKDPYNQGNDQQKYVFTESFDCEVWFTLPLWMGLLTLLTLFFILFTGVYYVAQISTPDRFENPKGKPLVIANVEE